MFVTNVVDREFMPRSGQTKDYNSGICCFTDAHAALRRMNKDWLDLNQDVSAWSNICICGLLCQLTRAIKIQLSVLV